MGSSKHNPTPETVGTRGPGEGNELGARARAVSELFREHNRTLVRFLQAKLQNEHEASEIAQEAYVRLLELGRTGAVSFLRAYLFRIAMNLAVDRIRTRNTRQRLDAAKLNPPPELDVVASIERQVFAADEMKVFWASLAELPQEHRQAFEMSRLEGVPTLEIAQRLGKSDRMIRRYIVRALVYCRYRVGGLSASEAQERMDDE